VQSPTPIQPTVIPIQPIPSASIQPIPSASIQPSKAGAGIAAVAVPAAEIIQPSEGEIVERNLVVSGRFTGLANGYSIWLYVRPSVEKRYYPLKVSYDPSTESWQVPIIVGSVAKDESGTMFEIGVFVATPQNNEILANGGENGLSKLPIGIVPMKSVNVRRK
jgi:hypothetical protein